MAKNTSNIDFSGLTNNERDWLLGQIMSDDIAKSTTNNTHIKKDVDLKATVKADVDLKGTVKADVNSNVSAIIEKLNNEFVNKLKQYQDNIKKGIALTQTDQAALTTLIKDYSVEVMTFKDNTPSVTKKNLKDVTDVVKKLQEIRSQIKEITNNGNNTEAEAINGYISVLVTKIKATRAEINAKKDVAKATQDEAKAHEQNAAAVNNEAKATENLALKIKDLISKATQTDIVRHLNSNDTFSAGAFGVDAREVSNENKTVAQAKATAVRLRNIINNERAHASKNPQIDAEFKKFTDTYNTDKPDMFNNIKDKVVFFQDFDRLMDRISEVAADPANPTDMTNSLMRMLTNLMHVKQYLVNLGDTFSALATITEKVTKAGKGTNAPPDLKTARSDIFNLEQERTKIPTEVTYKDWYNKYVFNTNPSFSVFSKGTKDYDKLIKEFYENSYEVVAKDIMQYLTTKHMAIINGQQGSGKTSIVDGLIAQANDAIGRPTVRFNAKHELGNSQFTNLYGGVAPDGHTQQAGLLYETFKKGGTVIIDEFLDMTEKDIRGLLEVIETGKYNSQGVGLPELNLDALGAKLIVQSRKTLNEAVTKGIIQSDMYGRLNSVEQFNVRDINDLKSDPATAEGMRAYMKATFKGSLYNELKQQKIELTDDQYKIDQKAYNAFYDGKDGTGYSNANFRLINTLVKSEVSRITKAVRSGSEIEPLTEKRVKEVFGNYIIGDDKSDNEKLLDNMNKNNQTLLEAVQNGKEKVKVDVQERVEKEKTNTVLKQELDLKEKIKNETKQTAVEEVKTTETKQKKEAELSLQRKFVLDKRKNFKDTEALLNNYNGSILLTDENKVNLAEFENMLTSYEMQAMKKKIDAQEKLKEILIRNRAPEYEKITSLEQKAADFKNFDKYSDEATSLKTFINEIEAIKSKIKGVNQTDNDMIVAIEQAKKQAEELQKHKDAQLKEEQEKLRLEQETAAFAKQTADEQRKENEINTYVTNAAATKAKLLRTGTYMDYDTMKQVLMNGTETAYNEKGEALFNSYVMKRYAGRHDIARANNWSTSALDEHSNAIGINESDSINLLNNLEKQMLAQRRVYGETLYGKTKNNNHLTFLDNFIEHFRDNFMSENPKTAYTNIHSKEFKEFASKYYEYFDAWVNKVLNKNMSEQELETLKKQLNVAIGDSSFAKGTGYESFILGRKPGTFGGIITGITDYDKRKRGDTTEYFGSNEVQWLKQQYGFVPPTTPKKEKQRGFFDEINAENAPKSVTGTFNNLYFRIKQLKETLPDLVQAINTSITKIAFSFSRLAFGVQVIMMNVTLLKTAFLGTFGYALNKSIDFTKQLVAQTEIMQKARITLTGVFGQEKSNEMVKFAEEYAVTSPATFEQITNMIRSFGLTPQIRTMLKQQTGEGFKTQMKDLADITTQLGMTKPEQGVEGAMFSIREAMAGQWRSLKMRFEIMPDAVAASIGKTVKEIEQSPELLTAAFKKFFQISMGEDTLQTLSQSVQIQIQNLYDFAEQLGQKIGESGFYKHIQDKVIGLSSAFQSLLDTSWINTKAQVFSDTLIKYADTLFDTVRDFALQVTDSNVIDPAIYAMAKDKVQSGQLGADKVEDFAKNTQIIKNSIDVIQDAYSKITEYTVKVAGFGTMIGQLFKNNKQAILLFIEDIGTVGALIVKTLLIGVSYYAKIFSYIASWDSSTLLGMIAKVTAALSMVFPIASMNIFINGFRILIQVMETLISRSLWVSLSGSINRGSVALGAFYNWMKALVGITSVYQSLVVSSSVMDVAKQSYMYRGHAVQVGGWMDKALTNSGRVVSENWMKQFTFFGMWFRRIFVGGLALMFVTGMLNGTGSFFDKFKDGLYTIVGVFQKMFGSMPGWLQSLFGVAGIMTFLFPASAWNVLYSNFTKLFAFIATISKATITDIITSTMKKLAPIVAFVAPYLATRYAQSYSIVDDAALNTMNDPKASTDSKKKALISNSDIIMQDELLKAEAYKQGLIIKTNDREYLSADLSNEQYSKFAKGIQKVYLDAMDDPKLYDRYMGNFKSFFNVLIGDLSWLTGADTAKEEGKKVVADVTAWANPVVANVQEIAGASEEAKKERLEREARISNDSVLAVSYAKRDLELQINSLDVMKKRTNEQEAQLIKAKETLALINQNPLATARSIAPFMRELDNTSQNFNNNNKDLAGYYAETKESKTKRLKERELRLDKEYKELVSYYNSQLKELKDGTLVENLIDQSISTAETVLKGLSIEIPESSKTSFIDRIRIAVNGVINNIVDSIVSLLTKIKGVMPVFSTGIDDLTTTLQSYKNPLFSQTEKVVAEKAIKNKLDKHAEEYKQYKSGIQNELTNASGKDRTDEIEKKYKDDLKTLNKELLEATNQNSLAKLQVIEDEYNARLAKYKKDYEGTKHYAEMVALAEKVELAKRKKAYEEFYNEIYKLMADSEYLNPEKRLVGFASTTTYELEKRIQDIQSMVNAGKLDKSLGNSLMDSATLEAKKKVKDYEKKLNDDMFKDYISSASQAIDKIAANNSFTNGLGKSDTKALFTYQSYLSHLEYEKTIKDMEYETEQKLARLMALKQQGVKDINGININALMQMQSQTLELQKQNALIEQQNKEKMLSYKAANDYKGAFVTGFKQEIDSMESGFDVMARGGKEFVGTLKSGLSDALSKTITKEADDIKQVWRDLCATLRNALVKTLTDAIVTEALKGLFGTKKDGNNALTQNKSDSGNGILGAIGSFFNIGEMFGGSGEEQSATSALSATVNSSSESLTRFNYSIEQTVAVLSECVSQLMAEMGNESGIGLLGDSEEGGGFGSIINAAAGIFGLPSFFADGGVVSQPTAAVIGEAGAEGVVPLKNGHIPVKLTGKTNGADGEPIILELTIVNTIDDRSFASSMARNGEVIKNVVAADSSVNGITKRSMEFKRSK